MNKQNMAIIRVVDDDAAMRRSWQFLIEGEGWTVRSYESAKAFLDLDDSSVPGCLVLDVRMPQMSGVELQHFLSLKGNLLPIIFVSAHGDIDMAVQALKDGASDFLQKPVKADRLISAIDKAVATDLKRREQQGVTDYTRSIFDTLTSREKDVAREVAKGLLNKQIAHKLNISEKTVQAHRGALCRKLRVRSAAEVTKILLSINES